MSLETRDCKKERHLAHQAKCRYVFYSLGVFPLKCRPRNALTTEQEAG